VQFRGNESSAAADKAEVALLSALLTLLATIVAAFVAETMTSPGASIDGATKSARGNSDLKSNYVTALISLVRNDLIQIPSRQ
jgi:hypothetical protein